MNIATLATVTASRSGYSPTVSDSRPLSSAFTAIVLLSAPRDRVFAELADIENLPRWAGGFVERVYLVRGRWAALTSLGELFLLLETNEGTGEITLWAGWDAQDLRPLPMQIAPAPEGGTTLRFAVPRVVDEDHARLCHALSAEWPGLFARLEKAGALEAGWRSN